MNTSISSPDQDLQQLNLLSIFYFIIGGLVGLSGCFFLMLPGLGISMLTGQLGEASDAEFVGTVFTVVGVLSLCLMWGLALATIAAGYFLRQRRAWVFCMAMAGLNCLSVPLGTILGVATIMVLTRPSVKAMFESGVQNSLP